MKHSHLTALLAFLLSVTLSSAPVFATEIGQESPEAKEPAASVETIVEEEDDDAEPACPGESLIAEDLLNTPAISEENPEAEGVEETDPEQEDPEAEGSEEAASEQEGPEAEGKK